MNPDSLLRKRVLIKSISELGTVTSHHRDIVENPVVVVTRDSNGETYCCGLHDVEVQPDVPMDDVNLLDRYCEVLGALELIVPGYREALNHHCGSMLSGERDSAIAILDSCEEILDKHRVSDELEAVESSGE